jgi:hypothetical protein
VQARLGAYLRLSGREVPDVRLASRISFDIVCITTPNPVVSFGNLDRPHEHALLPLENSALAKIIDDIDAPSGVVAECRLSAFHVAEIVKSPKVHELIHLSSYRRPVANGLSKMFYQQGKSCLLMKFYEFRKAT